MTQLEIEDYIDNNLNPYLDDGYINSVVKLLFSTVYLRVEELHYINDLRSVYGLTYIYNKEVVYVNLRKIFATKLRSNTINELLQ
jgi:hypothetical protein